MNRNMYRAMNINNKSLILTVSLFFALSASISAAPGDLDPTFGNGGIVIGGVPYTLANAEGMALQADGKIVVVGDTYDFRVARYNPNGSLDTSFGGGGVVVTPGIGSAYSVAIQADGKIVVAGGGIAVVRYNPNGSLDTTFNGTGIVSTQINNGSSHARSVAIQSDGKIVVAGDNSTGPFTLAFALVRYNTNGSLDTSFDNDGIVTTQVGSAFSLSGADAVAIQADGKIVAAGYYNGLVRYNADGSLDTTFNGTGILTNAGLLVAIQADGKILTAGGNGLLRYNANGTRDTSFGGTDGVATGIGGVGSVAIQADGKIVAAGSTGGAFAVTRLHGNGSPDTSFGGTGTVITPLDPQGYYYGGASAVAIQPDGKIVAAGVAIEPVFDSLTVALVRYQGDTPCSSGNPIDCAVFFVRQHYLDFLNREPDPLSAQWVSLINSCPPGDATCDRVHVSSAFFQSPEFQQRGYFLYRFYPVALGRKPDYNEFTPDLAKVSGFLTDAQLETAKLNFIAEFMSRPAFVTKFNGLDNTAYVDSLLTTAGITHPSRDLWIAALAGGSKTRAQVLREIVESTEVYNKYYNQAFVVMQYFGYLRRDPDILYLNWIAHLEATGDYRSMIQGFMDSIEYRARFRP